MALELTHELTLKKRKPTRKMGTDHTHARTGTVPALASCASASADHEGVVKARDGRCAGKCTSTSGDGASTHAERALSAAGVVPEGENDKCLGGAEERE